MSVRLVPARLTHVGPIACRMRAIDRRECEALGRTPKDALRSGIRSSLSAFSAISEDKPIAMLGVVPVSLIGGNATVWMLGTDDVFRQGRALLDLGPRVIGFWLETFEALQNIVSTENAAAIRLLERWGFDVVDEPETHRGVEFVPFRIERSAIQAGRAVA